MGVANCVEIAPQLFSLKDDGLSTVTMEELPMDLTELAERAALNCPTGAIVRMDDETSP